MIGLRRPAAHFAALALAATVSAFGGCSGTPPEGYRNTSMMKSPEPFRAWRVTLNTLARHRKSNDAAGARAMSPEILTEGKRFVDMKPPFDLKRENIPRVLEARARYIDLLNAWNAAVLSGSDSALWSASDDLESGFWAWYDAYRGTPSESSV